MIATATDDQAAELEDRMAELRQAIRLAEFPEAVQVAALELAALRRAAARR
jgi:hypothetical protein